MNGVCDPLGHAEAGAWSPKVSDGETRSALVTGAAHGIGLAVARRFLDAGLRVIAVDNDGPHLHEALGDRGALLIVHDVAERPRELAAQVLELAGHCQVIVNNVGVADGRRFLDLPPEGLARSWATNVAGPWELTRLLVRDLIEARERGSVVFVLSLHATRVRLCPDYSVSKAGLRMLVAELAAELGQHGIRTNGVSPGDIDTGSSSVLEMPKSRTRRAGIIPIGRLGRADEVAAAVEFLCDDERACYINGADLRVDGGLGEFSWVHRLDGPQTAQHQRIGLVRYGSKVAARIARARRSRPGADR
jgi:NAD(P)-dependent dehydrogenase (short-subunit alcohol dehydrogenase family)